MSHAESLADKLQQCSQFSDDTKRLACYDGISGNLRQYAEQQFGHEQQVALEETPESITATIRATQAGAYDKYTFTLDNGQVWRQIDNTRNIWKGGEEVILERGAFGSFFMRKITGGRSLRVKRIQ
ncbi:hypothetical protein PVT68_00325 [Microbulbifer bruguierae]|uniref:Uncharacterized protein n=1 Tax=Microbulbifer bruguierae TaxID=3029061 RepID=A0ABY8NDT2_9GAMM|nr:hypothetical protein [Microbulbifer bruguierae]WGL16767.1 hypothetical protein PVT68_00325 [Microbulbifer bruguierae]